MLGGGEEKIAAQHAADKLTARERLALLIDEGTFVELGIHGRPHFSQRAMDGHEAPADGVITGYGKVNGRLTAVAAYDFTVMAGSMGMTGELKVTRLRELALTKRIPLVWLLDSAGARIQEAVGSLFAGSGHLFREEVVMSGVIPQVAALMGPCAAGTAYIPGLADFVPMVKGRGSMALAGPHLVRAAVGEDVTQEELGGSRVHCRKSGVGDLEVADDPECIEQIKHYLSFFPAELRGAAADARHRDPVDRGDEELLDVLPESNRKPYDMYEVIRRIVDDGDYFDLKPQFAKTIITCLARFGGRPAGIVANQPKQLGGILDNDSADKAARFINLCNAYGIPLVYLMDVPGFMVGTKVEEAGIIRHGAKMLYATANATVPKITVVLRKAYGAGYYVMCGRAYEPDLIVAWPSAEISVMGAEGAVEIIFRKQVEEAEDPAAKRQELIENFRKIIDVYVAAGNDMIDDVIDPRETRATICRALEMAAGKRVRAAVEAIGSGPGMSGDEPRPAIITCAISGAIANRDQCPAIPYTPEEYAAEARRIVDEGGVHIHIHARTPDGTPSYEVEDFAAIRDAIVGRDRRRRDHQLLHRDRRRAGGQADRLPGGVPARGGGAEHGLAQLRQVLALAQGLRVQVRVHQPVRRDHRAAGGDAPAGHQARARVLRRRPRRLAGAAGRHGPARGAAARRLRHGRGRRRAGHRPQPGGDGRQPAPSPGPTEHASLGRDRDRPRPVDAGRRRAHAGRLGPGRAGGQLLPARRRDGALQRRPDRQGARS